MGFDQVPSSHFLPVHSLKNRLDWVQTKHLDIIYECGLRDDPDYDIFKVLVARLKLPDFLKPDLHLYTHSIDSEDFYRSADLVKNSSVKEGELIFVNNQYFRTKYRLFKTYDTVNGEQVWLRSIDSDGQVIGRDKLCLPLSGAPTNTSFNN